MVKVTFKRYATSCTTRRHYVQDTLV